MFSGFAVLKAIIRVDVGDERRLLRVVGAHEALRLHRDLVSVTRTSFGTKFNHVINLKIFLVILMEGHLNGRNDRSRDKYNRRRRRRRGNRRRNNTILPRTFTWYHAMPTIRSKPRSNLFRTYSCVWECISLKCSSVESNLAVSNIRRKRRQRVRYRRRRTSRRTRRRGRR